MVRMKTKIDFGFFAAFYSLFKKLKATQITCFIGAPYLGDPFKIFTVPVHSSMPARILAVSAGVLRIGHYSGIAEIMKAIVQAIPIDVINHIRIGAKHHLPYDAMHFDRAVNLHDKPLAIVNITGRLPAPTLISGSVSGGVAWSQAPCQHPRFGVIFKQLAQFFSGRQWFCGHDAVLSRCGQGRFKDATLNRPAFVADPRYALNHQAKNFWGFREVMDGGNY